MINKDEISNETIENLQILDKFQVQVFNAKSTDELLNIANSLLEEFSTKKPSQIRLNDGTTKYDDKGKLLILSVLENDIIALKNNSYSNLINEKFALSSDIALLMGVYSNLSIEKILEITGRKARR